MKPDLRPDEIDALIAHNDQLARDTEKLLASIDDDEFLPTPLDTVIAGLVAIVAVGIGIAAVIGVIHIFGG